MNDEQLFHSILSHLKQNFNINQSQILSFEIFEQNNNMMLRINFNNPQTENKELLTLLPKYTKIKANSSLITNLEVCCVCLENYEEGRYVRRLGCTHVFHKTCIDKCVRNGSYVCPICRGNIFEIT